MIKLKSILIPAVLITFYGCSPNHVKHLPRSHQERLTHQIETQINEPELQSAILGIMVQSLETGEILYEHNAKKLLMPASNEKIPTSAAALLNFGPDFTFKTNVYIRGDVQNDVLLGDLIVVGSGDPTIGYRACENRDSCTIFEPWIRSLKSIGIDSISGHLIGVDDVFDDEAVGYGWTLDNLSYSYAPQIGGLNFNENYARVSVFVDSASRDIRTKIFPDCVYLNLLTDIEIIEDEEAETEFRVWRQEGTNDVYIRGKMRPNERRRTSVSIHNPTRYFLAGLRSELKKLGIGVRGNLIDSDSIEDPFSLSDVTLVHTHVSAPFSDILTTLMKVSQNLYAESFVKLLGAHFGREGSFEEGEKVIKKTLRRLGLAEDSYSFMDGSGLSRYNYISPYLIVKILRGMYYHKYRSIFISSLPLSGVDGTIGYRTKNTVAQNNIRAKTGTISNVRCLSGYATTKDGEVLAFSIMANNFLCSVHVIMDLQDRISMLLASHSRSEL
ncbi:MAG: D-alanyl-D-alanine carboxypeptidase/D-alanyl-D-alanine-endopeptidase [candidate division KSB1 bacterium]|jgi:D-alanyl-D-alanine carboxypeptidase/D-alanyl-D-alanine-endopeptidase (penicillin-binding protein 4)|nr:D-alanyl-D-alanine carboxypeptidase/D-alanyl-D-alanine-endopeptidase [candidate division KSB1 bacterium]